MPRNPNAIKLAPKEKAQKKALAATLKNRRQSEYLNEARALARDIEIPSCTNPKRRAKAEKDVLLWLPTYLGSAFYKPFTDQRIRMIRDILETAAYGGDKGIAAPRGDGKTTIAEGVMIFCLLTGRLRFPFVCAATGNLAKRIIKHIKLHLETSDMLDEDYPEVIAPIRALKGSGLLGVRQTVAGERTRIEWSDEQICLPAVPNSIASGAVIACAGMESAIRGIRHGVTRPDFILIDDPETRESCKSEEQTQSRRLIIEEDLAGLGAGDKKLGRVLLSTVMRRCTAEGNATISFAYTDRESKPSWDGDRFRAIEKWPENMSLWEEYQTLRIEGQKSKDKYGRNAHQFYLTHLEEMNTGAVVGNPYNFDRSLLPDGSEIESSTLEKYFNIISDKGLDHFLTEYNNEPPLETAPVGSGISAAKIQMQVSGFPRRTVPTDCVKLVQGIDVRKVSLHYVVRAWRQDCTCYIIDYGVENVYGTVQGSDEGVGNSIKAALSSRRDMVERNPYTTEDGQVVPMDLTLVDAGWKTEDIYDWCRDAGQHHFKPSMGFGKSSGCVKTSFSEVVRPTQDKRMGQHWFLSRRPGSIWLVCIDADFWKEWEHDHWMRDPGVPGVLYLYGKGNAESPRYLSPDQKSHFVYSKHITAEEIFEEIVGGVLERYWKAKSDTNHYLDASVIANVAASMVGVLLVGKKKRMATEENTWYTPGGQLVASTPVQETNRPGWY